MGILKKTKTLFSSNNLSIPGSLSNSYFPQLDGLRGVAITTVLISHYIFNYSLKYYDIGNIGVETFFVLSGFLITTLILKEKIKQGTVSLKRFYIRRALRILPVAYLFLLVLLFLNYIFKLNISSGSFFASIFYVRNFHYKYDDSWANGHFWTLAVEEQFYILFPILIVHSLKNYIRLIFLIIFSVPLLVYVGFHNIGIFYSNYLIHKITFLCINLFRYGTVSILVGSLLSILMFKKIMPTEVKNSNRYLSFFLFLFAAFFRMTLVGVLGFYINSLLFSVIVALIIYLTLVNSGDFLGTLLKNKWLVHFGVLSYSVYIWQQIFLYRQPWDNTFKYSNSLIFS